MDVNKLRDLLVKSDNKFEILVDIETFKKYNVKVSELCDLIDEFLNDEEILKLFDYQLFNNLDAWKKNQIINEISNKDVLVKVLKDDNIIENLGKYNIVKIIKKISDDEKEKILNQGEFLENYGFSIFEKKEIINSLSEDAKFKILSDKELIYKKMNITEYEIIELVAELEKEEEKKKLVEIYDLKSNAMVNIVKTYSDLSKEKFLLENPDLSNYVKKSILASFEVSSLIDFINNHHLEIKGKINVYEIVNKLDEEKQLEFISNLENINLTENEKKEIYAIMKTEVKEKIDKSKLPEKFKVAINMKISDYSEKIILDLNKNLNDYQGLDNLLSVNPSRYNEEEKRKFKELCNICPNLEVTSLLYDNNAVEYSSTAMEYMQAEEWIQKVLDKLKPDYTVTQKIAVIDNAIGKKISYSPDFETEIFSNEDCRALYKIISSGYGVCNGVARVEQYILEKIGVDCDIISSCGHAFLKLKNVEFVLANGENTKGTTILDPTWNLAEHRFGGKPNNFCISYEEARKRDIDSEQKDHYCHKNDEELKDATFNLDDKSLRKLFRSVDLADKDGNFPIKKLFEESELINKQFANQSEKIIENQLALISKFCPEFATCQNSTMKVMEGLLLDNDEVNFNNCEINRVYDKSDVEKKPVVYLYVNSCDFGEKFYFADKEENMFKKIEKEEFIKKFDCYETDLQKNNGVRPWETIELEQKEINLATSSGNIVFQEEGSR